MSYSGIYKPALLHSLCALLWSAFILAGCSENPEPQWYKGNLHAHSYWSDGDDYPESVMKWYKDHGYDFAVLSEHNRFAEGDRWINPQKGTVHETTFQAYLDTFGEEWVDYEEEDDRYRVRLKTLEEYRPLFEAEGEFLIIRSMEITDEYEGAPVHLNATNIRHLVEPQGGESVAEVKQNNIDAVLQQREETGRLMITHLNHPNFLWAITPEDYKMLDHARFFEVYNGHQLVNNRGDDERPGTEEIWDRVNTRYVMENRPLLFGVAVDDAHNYHEFEEPRANPGRGWIQVRSRSLHADSLMLAMDRGDFYASTGVVLQNIHFEGNGLRVDIEPEEGVNYTIQFIGTLSSDTGNPGIVLDEAEGTSAGYTFTGDELFVRAKIISDKPMENTTVAAELEKAWVQPFQPD